MYHEGEVGSRGIRAPGGGVWCVCVCGGLCQHRSRAPHTLPLPAPFKVLALPSYFLYLLCMFMFVELDDSGSRSRPTGSELGSRAGLVLVFLTPPPGFVGVALARVRAASGYIRPAIREPGRLFCLDAERIPRPALDGPPMVGVCNPARKAQVWQLNPIPGTAGLVQFYNPHVDRCVGAIPSANPEVKAGWAVRQRRHHVWTIYHSPRDVLCVAPTLIGACDPYALYVPDHHVPTGFSFSFPGRDGAVRARCRGH